MIDPSWLPIYVAIEEDQKRALEEEEMAHYSAQDLAEDWEFKIVRASFTMFRKPENLARLVEEEARFGWVMLEKLDDGRVRFKRPRSARSLDANAGPGVDPYRSLYRGYNRRDLAVGLTAISLAAVALVAIAGTVVAIVLLTRLP